MEVMVSIRIFLIFLLVSSITSLENLALYKTAEMSIQRNDDSGAEGAVDGDITQTVSGGTCALTKVGKYNEAWWRVDLNGTFAITELKIYLLNTDLFRFRYYSVHVTDTLGNWKSTNCKNDHQSEKGPNVPIFTLNCDAKGRYVTILLDRSKVCTSTTVDNACAILQLCEVQVLGCQPGNYGDSCNLKCPTNCGDDMCSIDQGKCYQCKDGYLGDTCQNKCTAGYYGQNCKMTCTGFCADGQPCSHINGKCVRGCMDGYFGEYCDKPCSPGYFGSNCSKACGKCINNETCNHTNGMCKNGCNYGWNGLHCNTSCEAGKYGMNCQHQCDVNCVNSKDCDRITGSCNGGCQTGWTGKMCNTVCKNGTFGNKCSERCGMCNNATCNHINGYCASGCTRGFEGLYCNVSCKAHTYGYNCNQSCSGQCRNRKTCNRLNGHCDDGCERGWKGIHCNETCVSETYGYNCEQRCSGNCKGGISCTRTDGSCNNGCKAGWKGTHCNKRCGRGYFGENCAHTCGQCYQGTICDRRDGKCNGGCASGFNGSTCKKRCQPGTFGRDCRHNCSGNCLNNDVCNGTTGICVRGCDRGWKRLRCTKPCLAGRYGYGCNDSCGHCIRQTTCDVYNGSCHSGCENGWTGSTCKRKCPYGTYGFKCKGKCSNYCDTPSCNKATGVCDTGCQRGWKGIFCNESCTEGTYGAGCIYNCSVNCKGNESCSSLDGSCPYGCLAGWMEEKCDQVCPPGLFGENCLDTCGMCSNGTSCDMKTGYCKEGCVDGYVGKYCSQNETYIGKLPGSDENPSVLAAMMTTLIFIIVTVAVVLMAVYFYRKRRQLLFKRTQKSSEKQLTPPKPVYENVNLHFSQGTSGIYSNQIPDHNEITEDTEPLTEVDSDLFYCNTIMSTHDIRVTNLQEAIQMKSLNRNKIFEDEYKALPESSMQNCTTAQIPVNVKKNRYKTTLAYDHSRVKLKTKSNNGTDYINANYIDGVKNEKRYIASQGPKESSFRDHWCMIWQEGVHKIVMLTNLVEKGKKKCDMYWPGDTSSSSMTAGEFTITSESEQVYASFTIRNLRLTNTKLKTSRSITHFHFTTWPDHGVPDPLELVLFHIRVRGSNVNGPLLVHCSAGIGRTGTFLALDALIEDCKTSGKINVFNYAQLMRRDRMGMIQNVNQYIGVHTAVLEHLRTCTHNIPKAGFADDMNTRLKSRTYDYFYKDFKEIEAMKPSYGSDDYKTALLQTNKTEIFSGDILPVEKYAAFLSTDIDEKFDYINAVYVPSYTDSHAFIVTQIPKADAGSDFYRLLLDHNVTTVVTLLSDDRRSMIADFIPDNGSQSTFGDIQVQVKPKAIMMKDIVQITVTVQRQALCNTVQVFKIRCIRENVFEKSKIDLFAVVTSNIKPKTNIQRQRTVVMSRDGVTGCGLFVTLYNAIEQLHHDHEVDIPTIVRRLKVRRPQLCPNLNEYKLCYQAVADHLTNSCIYANT